MRITVVSRSWPVNERSGVTLAAAEHVRMLVADGHDVSIVGAHATVLEETLPVVSRFHVPAHGSGAFYAPVRIDRRRLVDAIRGSAPTLVVVESWQTALTDAAVDVASELGLPVLMVSHGVALHPFTPSLADRVRSFAWTYYRIRHLPKRIARLSVLTTLDETAPSFRFYDRDLARRLGIPVLPLVNAPVNWVAQPPDRLQRKPQIIVVGYYSPVKNQLGALKVMAGLPKALRFLFVGRRGGSYFERCCSFVRALGLEGRVTFSEDHECNLANEIASSLVVLSTSTTEALPISLLEAMASGTPFVATPVGAVSSLQAGIVAADTRSQREAVTALVSDSALWCRLAKIGREQWESRFTQDQVHRNLRQAVEAAVEVRSGATPTSSCQA